jgi:hypothetical protein
LGLLIIAALAIIVSAPTEAGEPEKRAQVVFEIDSVKGYAMAHSLWQHGSTEHHTGEWLGRFARHAKKSSSWLGRFGQLDQHASMLPIIVKDPYDNDGDANSAFGYPSNRPFDPWVRGEWSAVGWDHVMTTPWNFAQESTPFDTKPDPLDYALSIVDFWVEYAPGAKKMFFEHWPETSMVPGVPGSSELSPAQWILYWEYTGGDYHDWFVGFMDAMQSSRPDAELFLVPVGAVLADLFLTQDYMKSASSSAYFEDDAPHGTPALYFLSAMVFYRQMYGVSVESTYRIPRSSAAQIPPEIQENLASIIQFIDTRLSELNANGVRVY